MIYRMMLSDDLYNDLRGYPTIPPFANQPFKMQLAVQS